MATKKNNSAEAKSSAKVEPTFSKEQILASAKYAKRRDLVDALLDDKQYTMKAVDEAINDYYKKGQVK